MNKQYFITGTDTGVGKTIASTILTLALQAVYWKPIQSGLLDEISDAERVQALTQLPDANFYPTPYSFKASLSPDQAAFLEQKTIELSQCKMPLKQENMIVEGAGGVYVPLNDEHCMLDLMKKLGLPIIIVSRGTLGTINHTLLTIAALREAGLTIRGIVFNGPLNPQNQFAIERWGKVETLFHIPSFDSLSATAVQSWTNKNKSSIQERLL